jgi:hypothetical protein
MCKLVSRLLNGAYQMHVHIKRAQVISTRFGLCKKSGSCSSCQKSQARMTAWLCARSETWYLYLCICESSFTDGSPANDCRILPYIYIRACKINNRPNTDF